MKNIIYKIVCTGQFQCVKNLQRKSLDENIQKVLSLLACAWCLLLLLCFSVLERLTTNQQRKWGLGGQMGLSQSWKYQRIKVIKLGSSHQHSEIRPWLSFSKAPHPWMNSLTSSSLPFLIHTMSTLVVLLLCGCYKSGVSSMESQVWLVFLGVAEHSGQGDSPETDSPF